jgi:hypothetical protein
MNNDIPVPPVPSGFVFHAPLKLNLYDVVNNLQGTGYGTYSITPEGAEFFYSYTGNAGGIRFSGLPISFTNWLQSWTITYTIKNNAINIGHQTAVEIGSHRVGGNLALYSPEDSGFKFAIHFWIGGGDAIAPIVVAFPNVDYTIFRNEKVVWNSTEQKFYFYINDTLIAASNVVNSFPTLSNDISIGGGINNGALMNGFLRGIIRDIRIYDKVV